MEGSHVFLVEFGDDSSRKGVALRYGMDDCTAELLVSDITDANGKAYKLGEVMSTDMEHNIFLSLTFQDKKDWDNFVYIVNYQNEKFKEWYEEKHKVKEKEDADGR